MSLSVKERLKQLGIELVHDERVELDKAIEQATKKKCDEGVHLIPDIVFVQLVDAVICKMRKNRKSKIINNLDNEILENVEAEEIPA